MLMQQKAYAEGLRSLYIYTAAWLDRALLAEDAGDSDAAALAHSVNDLLLPLVKGFGSERSYALLASSLQVFGGSGYLQDYPIEQYIRDTKIDTLYEGTTGIQGQDFFFRKIARDRQVAWTALSGEIEAFLTEIETEDRLESERGRLAAALTDVRAMAATLLDWSKASRDDAEEVYKVGQNTTRLLLSVGDLLVGWLLTRQAAVALKALDAGGAPADVDFYRGKLAVAKFFTGTVLPELSARRSVLEQTDNALMAVADGSF
jgi:Acetyl-CoA dehydrogenase C-terminal like/Acyl-CoA dehydrogenase, C-terminal domain